MSEAVAEFFDDIGDEYNDAIARCVPRYREMLWALTRYHPTGWQPRDILDLGCGSGNLTETIAKTFPDAATRALDLSPKLLAQCAGRMTNRPGMTCQQADMRTVEFPAESFDLVVSSIAIHHLRDDEKRDLFRRIHAWLRPSGVFAYSDQFAGATDDIYAKHIADWHDQSRELGSSEEDWDAWMRHQDAQDFHASLPDQLDWLRQAGFRVVDCPWRYLLWTVLYAFR